MLTVLIGDALEQLRTLPDESVQCCVTSPPYWGLRDYGTAAWEGAANGCDHLQTNDTRDDPAWCTQTQNAGTSQIGFKESCGKCGAKRIDSQLGLEKTPEEYVAKMVEVFRAVRRVLRKDGTLWLNLGDSYASSGSGSGSDNASHRGDDCGNFRNGLAYVGQGNPRTAVGGLKPKDLCGIPWRVAFALQADGWWLRSDIIWAKPNPMPESVTDRPTKSHEYLFLLTKSASYFYDAEAIKEGKAYSTVNDDRTNDNGHRRFRDYPGSQTNGGTNLGGSSEGNRNKRSVWTIATAPYPEAHFATYPPNLIKPCIMAGTSAKGCCSTCGAPWQRIVERGETTMRSANDGKGYIASVSQDMQGMRKGILPNASTEIKTIGWRAGCEHSLVKNDMPCTVLDPFAGSGTTGMVALELGRNAVLIELNPKYCELIRQRCDITPGLQLA